VLTLTLCREFLRPLVKGDETAGTVKTVDGQRAVNVVKHNVGATVPGPDPRWSPAEAHLPRVAGSRRRPSG
jgi:hypothetical protein